MFRVFNLCLSVFTTFCLVFLSLLAGKCRTARWLDRRVFHCTKNHTKVEKDFVILLKLLYWSLRFVVRVAIWVDRPASPTYSLWIVWELKRNRRPLKGTKRYITKMIHLIFLLFLPPPLPSPLSFFCRRRRSSFPSFFLFSFVWMSPRSMKKLPDFLDLFR